MDAPKNDAEAKRRLFVFIQQNLPKQHAPLEWAEFDMAYDIAANARDKAIDSLMGALNIAPPSVHGVASALALKMMLGACTMLSDVQMEIAQGIVRNAR